MSFQEVSIYNSLHNKKVKFETLTPGVVKFYSCGPTTYDFLHVGNARAQVVADLFFRGFQSLGYQVTFVRNFTDVDDKIIERAKELGVDALEHSARFVDECKKDMASLGLLDPNHTPKVSECIPEIIEMIESLVAKGFAYIVGGEVLYSVEKFEEYGKLSNRDLDELKHGARVEVSQDKKHPSDFVLWKPAKEGEIFWDSPWGKGRPGWHIECSAMAKKFLGETIDLHHGGIDLIFPHHENEIAQSEAANGCAFCEHWAYNEFLNFGSEKMSKSLGNVVTIRAFVENYGGPVLRHVLASVHYRSKMEWSEEVIERGIQEVERIHQFALDFEKTKSNSEISSWGDEGQILGLIQEMKNDLTQDFNTPGVLGKFFTLVRDVNRELVSNNKKAKNPVEEAIGKVIEFFTFSTGLLRENPTEVLAEVSRVKKKKSGATASDEEVETLISERKQARADKNWARADEIRDRLNELGVMAKDNPDGSVSWEWK